MRSAPILSRCATLLIALAVAVRVLVPQGFMLAPAAQHGLPSMVICTGDGAMKMPMPDHRPAKRDAADRSCPFAASGAAVDLARVTVPDAARVAPRPAIQPRPLATQPGRGLAAPPPPKTGPPSTA